MNHLPAPRVVECLLLNLTNRALKLSVSLGVNPGSAPTSGQGAEQTFDSQSLTVLD